MLPFHVFAPILLQLFWSKTIFSSFLIPFPLQVRFRNYRQIIFTRNIFSSFPIIHRGKRTFHKMMTFSIRYFVTLRSLHISYGVSEYIFHLSFPFLFFLLSFLLVAESLSLSSRVFSQWCATSVAASASASASGHQCRCHYRRRRYHIGGWLVDERRRSSTLGHVVIIESSIRPLSLTFVHTC